MCYFEPPAHIAKNIRWDTSITIGAFSMLHGPGSVAFAKVGRYCSIAPGTVIGANEHAAEWLSTSSLFENPNLFDWHASIAATRGKSRNFPGSLREINIGNDVWIGLNCFIQGGVTIGDGAIVGPMSNVIQDVPPYAVVAGNPARIVRYRFEPDVIRRLLELRWWRFSISDLQRFNVANPAEAAAEIRDAELAGELQEFNPGFVQMTPEER
jgi:acetyltransferase-like isoleucine patch superfamily enzyme